MNKFWHEYDIGQKVVKSTSIAMDILNNYNRNPTINWLQLKSKKIAMEMIQFQICYQIMELKPYFCLVTMTMYQLEFNNTHLGLMTSPLYPQNSTFSFLSFLLCAFSP